MNKTEALAVIIQAAIVALVESEPAAVPKKRKGTPRSKQTTLPLDVDSVDFVASGGVPPMFVNSPRPPTPDPPEQPVQMDAGSYRPARDGANPEDDIVLPWLGAAQE